MSHLRLESPPPVGDGGAGAGDVARRLRQVAVIAVVDALLLAGLVTAAILDAEGVVDILGPLHGFVFLIELFVVVRGAGDQLWGWWFPPLVFFTGGPLGALIGHRIVSRQLRRDGGGTA